MRILYYLVAAIIVAALAFFLKFSILGDICGAIIGPLIVAIIDFFVIVNSKFGLFLKGHTIFRKKNVRFSISYLYKIKIHGKYLLVRGHRIPDQFQPVGGVIKRFKESNQIFTDLGILDDEQMPIDDISQDDLRVLVPGKSIIPFIKWYESRKGREISYEREFKEELLEENILPQHDFKHIEFKFLKTQETRIHFSDHFQCHEILMAEILELMPTEVQVEDLKKTMNMASDKYIWTTADTIHRKGYNKDGKSYRISETTAWTL